MPTEENKAVVRHIFEEVFNKGNISALDELIADSYVYHLPGNEDVKGLTGVKEFISQFRETFPDLHFTIEDMIAEGEKVSCRYTIQGTHKGIGGLKIPPTGKRINVIGIIISHLADGKVVEDWGSPDGLGMLQQLGVIPEMK